MVDLSAFEGVFSCKCIEIHSGGYDLLDVTFLVSGNEIIGVVAAQGMAQRYLGVVCFDFCACVAMGQNTRGGAHVGAGVKNGFRREVVGGPVLNVNLDRKSVV